MPERIRVDLADIAGNIVATSSTFSSLNAALKMSDRGSIQIGFSSDDPLAQNLGDDYIIKLFYQYPEEGIDWINVGNGIVKTKNDAQSVTGKRSVTLHCPTEEELFAKAHILYFTGTTQSSKSGECSAVIAELVSENIGGDALVSNGRFYDGQNPISIVNQAPSSLIWAGSRSQKNLLEVMSEIRDYSITNGDQIDFRCTYQDGYTFIVEVGKLGIDRTIEGVTQVSKGLNGAGNIPIVWSPYTKNLERFSISRSRYNEANVVVALGPGIESSRLIGVSVNEASRSASPISQREHVVSGTDQASVAELETKAQARMNKMIATNKVNAYPLNRKILAFRDYFLGDFVTVGDFDGGTYTRQITEITLNASRESGIETRVKVIDE
jgi:hypothetical protein